LILQQKPSSSKLESLLSPYSEFVILYMASTTRQVKIMIIQHKTDLMRQMIRLISHGYQYWVSGSVPASKATAMTLKFDDRYSVKATSQQRYRRKKRGEANAQLLMWPVPDSEDIQWWLLATEGTGLIHQMETLCDGTKRSSRIEITGYELLKTPREGNRPTWTWRMTTDNYEQWQKRLRDAVRYRRYEAIGQAIFSLRRVPGFSESRRQAFLLERLAIAEWKRSQKDEWPHERIYIGWLGRYQKAKEINIKNLF